MSDTHRLRPSRFLLLLMLAIAPSAFAQARASALDVSADVDSMQTAQILGLDHKLRELHDLQAQHPFNTTATLEEILIRQDLLESIQAASLDVDNVLAEISNESAQLADLRFSLSSRRDRTVSRLNAAAFIAGSGLGVAASATQFTNLSTRTQNLGDGIGVGSGVASTIFSIMAVRRQKGPSGSVGVTPNMLAPLLGGTPILSTDYPPAVLQYLQSVPVSGDSTRGTRLERLKADWVQAGRLDPPGSVTRQQKIAVLTTSMDKNVKVSIDDLSDRIAMLTDVRGRVSLMKRDLRVLMRSYLSHALASSRTQVGLGPI